MKTCHDHFEESGNPWLTERERKNLQASLLPAAGGRRYARPKLPYTDPIQDGRKLTEHEIKGRGCRKNVDLIAQLTGCKPRTLKPLVGVKVIVDHIRPPSMVELSWDRESIEAEAERQKRQWKQWMEAEKTR